MSNVKDAIEAVQGIVESVPVYEDMLQPASKELGKSFLTISKLVNIALSPLTGLVWGYEKIAEYLESSMAEKLKDLPEENIITPNPSVAVPAVEALRYTAHNEDLREMFSNLLATAMDKDKAAKAHPSFVEVIKQINSDEAKIIKLLVNDQSKAVVKMKAYNKELEISHHYLEPMKEFSVIPEIAGCEHPELGPSYINNLERLGIIQLTYDSYSTLPNSYEPIVNHPEVIKTKEFFERLDKRVELQRGSFSRSEFGKNFYESCVLEK